MAGLLFCLTFVPSQSDQFFHHHPYLHALNGGGGGGGAPITGVLDNSHK